jgi:predicted lipid-binding transport protein (Tim44 family)
MATRSAKPARKAGTSGTTATSGATAKEQAVRPGGAEPENPAAPAKTTPTKAAPAPANTTPTKAAPASAAEVEGEGEGEVFLNRAQRRAKGRTPSQAQFAGRGKVTGGHGPASTQRNWANRRSG